MQSPGEPGGSEPEALQASVFGRPVKLAGGPTLLTMSPAEFARQMVVLALVLVVLLLKEPQPADPVSCMLPSGIVTNGCVPWVPSSTFTIQSPLPLLGRTDGPVPELEKSPVTSSGGEKVSLASGAPTAVATRTSSREGMFICTVYSCR